MSPQDMQLALEKLIALRNYVDNYFEHEENIPGIYWSTIFPITHTIDNSISVMDGHVQLQQIQEKQAS